MTMSDVPPPVSLLLAIDRAVRAFNAWWTPLCEELIFAFTSADERDAVNRRVHSGHPDHQIGSAMDDAGLTTWEDALVRRAALPLGATILVGGCGAGREMVALAGEGYRTLGIDPSRELLDAGRARVTAAGGKVCLASYEDLTAFVERGDATGPLFEFLNAERIDAVLLAWGSLVYVRDPDMRRRLFHALRAIAPNAQLLVGLPTFPGRPRWQRTPPAQAGWMRHWLWSVACGPWPRPGERFFRMVGFAATIDEDELCSLAAAAGYAVTYARFPEYAHVILAPDSTSGATD